MPYQDELNLSSVQEMYLKTILILSEENKVARVKDLAERLEITKASVTSGLKTLIDKGLIEHQPYSHVTLTELGQEIAEAIVQKFHVIVHFLEDTLQMTRELAESNACRMEHVVDLEVIERLDQYNRVRAKQ
ncbi:MAG: DtxR family iron (metal) dependent repressor [Waddliaceae bacterium]|nr:DtxR family iron (metal) dependent repressor [Waddliaceae bacterium]